MNEKKPKAAEAAFSAKSGELRTLVEETITEWFDEKHRARSEAEVAFTNSIVPESCPHCGSARIRKDGFAKKTGIRVYECLDPGCQRKFGPLTGTVFDSKKIPISETIEFLYHLFQFHSSTSSAESNMNADSTGLYRMAKLFLKRHGGYKREELQGWLNLFAFWYNTPGTAMEKAIKPIEMAAKKRRTLRYRDGGQRKSTMGADIGIPHVQIRVYFFCPGSYTHFSKVLYAGPPTPRRDTAMREAIGRAGPYNYLFQCE